jgi:hypothetical protein
VPARLLLLPRAGERLLPERVGLHLDALRQARREGRRTGCGQAGRGQVGKAERGPPVLARLLLLPRAGERLLPERMGLRLDPLRQAPGPARPLAEVSDPEGYGIHTSLDRNGCARWAATLSTCHRGTCCRDPGKAGSGARAWLDRGDKPRDDKSRMRQGRSPTKSIAFQLEMCECHSPAGLTPCQYAALEPGSDPQGLTPSRGA